MLRRQPVHAPSKANAFVGTKPACSRASRVPPDGVGVSVQVTTVSRGEDRVQLTRSADERQKVVEGEPGLL